MKILLIYPPNKHMTVTEIPESLNKSRGHLPSLGLLYIGANLKRHNIHDVKVLDTQVENLSYKQIADRIAEERPNIVGIQVFTYSFLDALNVAEITKKVSKEIMVVMGGPHILFYPKETLNFPYVDYVVIGEGEEIFAELVETLSTGEKRADIKGVGYKDKGEIIVNNSPGIIRNLDDLPLPDRTMLPYQKYSSILSKNHPVTTMMTSRGCPYRCTFCHEAGVKYREASPAVVVSEIEECLKLGIREIFIHDDTFTVNRKRVFKICEEIMRRGLKFDWDVRGRVDTVNKDLLTMMKKAGCVRISYGVESGNQKVLDRLKKGITLEQIYKAFRYSKEVGITTLADFMIGSPGEGKEELSQTMNLLRKIKPDFVQFSLTTPFPGTKLYKQGIEDGIIDRDYWKEFATKPDAAFLPPAWEEILTREESSQWVRYAYKKHYLSPRFMFRSIFEVRSGRDFIDKARAMFDLIRLRHVEK